jgi:hypothetical protein
LKDPLVVLLVRKQASVTYSIRNIVTHQLAQAVWRWLLTTELLVQSPATSCDICSEVAEEQVYTPQCNLHYATHSHSAIITALRCAIAQTRLLDGQGIMEVAFLTVYKITLSVNYNIGTYSLMVL